MTAPAKVNYLSNKDLLEEIHKSKNSFCEYIDESYSRYDLIVENLNDIFLPENIQTAIDKRTDRLAAEMLAEEIKNSSKKEKPKLSAMKEKVTVKVEDLVFRVMGFDHIPEEEGRKKNPKKTSDYHTKLNFPPFKHFIITDLEKQEVKEVGRSHSHKGQFCMTHGQLTDKLSLAFILLVEKYGQRTNWRGYTYVDEMRGQALVHLTQVSLQFNEFKSDNPFSYFTAIVSNSFLRILKLEKTQQAIRDDILQDSGRNPSFGRQLAHEESIRKQREAATMSEFTDMDGE